MRKIPVVTVLLALIFILVPWRQISALTDEEKREIFLKSQVGAKASPRPKPKVAGGRSPTASPSAKPKPKPKPKPSASAAKKKTTPRSSRTPKATPRKSSTPVEPEEERRSTPAPSPASTPLITPRPLSTPRVAPTPPRSTPAPVEQVPIVIEKSGFEENQGTVPPPPPEPRRGFWFFGRSRPVGKYLTRSIREEIDRAKVSRRRWKFIVVHNSGTRQGNAKIFDHYHRNTRKMPNGLAYHFVIGNGTSSDDGEIEIGDRWRRQVNGGHVHSDYLNNIALGICLVGEFNRSKPTQAQLDSLEELVKYLRVRVDKIDGKVAIVKAHRDINPPQWPTDCPGDAFPYSWLHSRF